MKNLYILLLITVILLSGCSKASRTGSTTEAVGIATAATSQSADSSVYAYIPYMGGRIEAYKLVDGKMVGSGEASVGRIIGKPVVTPDGRFLYAMDYTQTITRFKIGEQGQLLEPISIKPELSNQRVRQCMVDPNGRFLFVRTLGVRDEDIIVGSVIVMQIATDGTLKQTSNRLAVDEAIGCIAMSPAGNLYISRRSGLEIIGVNSDGSLKPGKPINSSIRTTEHISFSSNGQFAALGQYKELPEVVFATVDDANITEKSQASLQDIPGGAPVVSILVDDNGNIVATNSSRWLYTFKMQSNQLEEAARYMIFKDHKVRSGDESEQFLVNTPEYKESYEILGYEPADRRGRRAIYSAAFYLASPIDSICMAPDGRIYASCTSGVYSFTSSSQGLAYVGPVVTWTDRADKLYGKNRAPESEMMRVQPIPDGMIFVQRK